MILEGTFTLPIEAARVFRKVRSEEGRRLEIPYLTCGSCPLYSHCGEKVNGEPVTKDTPARGCYYQGDSDRI